MSIYFTDEETGCRCGKCRRSQGMKSEVLRRADILRRMCGFPLNMSSGYRCPLHPKASIPHSGFAFDIKISHRKAYILVQNAMLMGFSGIGIHQKGNDRFIHLDDCMPQDGMPRPHIWSK